MKATDTLLYIVLVQIFIQCRYRLSHYAGAHPPTTLVHSFIQCGRTPSRSGETENAEAERSVQTARRNRPVFVALFAALICVSSVIAIPLPGGVPVVLKDMLAILAGLVLGGVQGAAATGLYLLAGMLGIPVFAGGGGLAAFASPSGGYLVGFLLGSLAAGLIAGRPSAAEKRFSVRQFARIAGAALAGFAVIYACGVFHLRRVNQLSLAAAIINGCVVFLPIAAGKMALLVALASRLRPIAARYVGDGC